MMAISPECDKSFTRSDALAKHMRQQHHIEPPAAGRGGSRKRKRNADETAAPPADAASATTTGFNTFKVEPDAGQDELPHFANGRSSRPVLRVQARKLMVILLRKITYLRISHNIWSQRQAS